MGETNRVIPQCDWRWLPTVDLTEAKHELFRVLQKNLDAGEAECLAVAIIRDGVIVTDDRGARKQAAKRSIPLAGTVGMLKVLIDGHHLSISQADEYLSTMIAQGYHSPIRRFSEL